MKKIILAAFVGALATLPGYAYADSKPWPALPKSGFISGRPATARDVQQGNAIFSSQIGGVVVGKPIPIEIPQYALLKNEKGDKIPVIVVQAEEGGGFKLLGMKDFDGKTYVSLYDDVSLLGRSLPN